MARCYRDGVVMTHEDLMVVLQASVARAKAARDAPRQCSQCKPGHDRGDGRCERHGKVIP